MQLHRLLVSGADSKEFLQRQLTADIGNIADGEQRLTAWCNIQGRVISLLWLSKDGESWILDVPAASYDKLMPRLKMYVLRDDVQFSEPQSQFGSMDENGHLIVSAQEVSDWKSGLIDKGIPYLETAACEEYLPQMLNLDLVSGLSFSKGCYPGQEIVARTHFRGKLKQRMLALKTAGEHGQDLFANDGSKAGTILISAADKCLAVVRLEKLGGGLKDADANAIEVLELPYAIPGLETA